MLTENKFGFSLTGASPVTILKTIAGRFWAPGPYSSLQFQTDYIAIETFIFFVTEFSIVSICNNIFSWQQ